MLMLSVKEKAFRNVIFVCALLLFLIVAVLFTYFLGQMILSIIGAFLMVVGIFLLIVTVDTWRKVKKE